MSEIERYKLNEAVRIILKELGIYFNDPKFKELSAIGVTTLKSTKNKELAKLAILKEIV